ncbi:2-oxoglutarate and iron-dependent oxygenase domain-containing protein 1 [Trachymyrmex septentrionalis]|uniref:uS12 prolyl 3-hydroxylase n=1 Tax=Trachymyrmex septentrionalis TaxID=34720 RepID=A0A195FPH1_9HYME|nr:PREDICTED: prolyl 3-hydroxylase OGFOD1 [Trachymyrmex septentrionalis]KYN42296.1 2-oxoglutarate and iron-dependent oxygenase domain-containing protein 1 [Trachymyrmex septentrionalis]
MANQKLFSEHIYDTKFQEEFKKHWHSQGDFKSANLEIISKPFKVCKISNFLRDEKILENLKSELECHDYIRKDLDLYQFEKTEDLYHFTDKHIQMLNSSFRNDLRSWMSRNTNIELNEKVLMSSARYRNTDYLLCHDDNTVDRRIAYILYLTADWSEKDGGTLDLFDMDEKGSPGKVVKSLIPEYNSLVFFEVVENSYHQVSEILSHDKCRWSINGWFHGPLKKDFRKSSRYEPVKTFLEPNSTKVNLHSWVSNDYLKPSIMDQIQEDVEISSYTFLKSFLKKSVYQQIANDIRSQDISWRMIGPPDICHYEIADEQTLPKLLRDFCDLFKSISFFQLLKKYTGLDLVPEKTKRPKMTLELQRWSSGCYTLLYDKSLLKDTSDESTLALTSDFSTNEINLDTNNTRRELKRERTDGASPVNSSDKRKVARYRDSQSDVGVHSGKHENSVDVDETSSSSDDIFNGTLVNDSEDDSASENGEFLLDVIIQFHTQDAKGTPKTEDTIDFVNPGAQEGVLIQIPMQDNHLCLVYRSVMICRLHKYLNHFYDGYSYTFICTYYE